MNGRLQGGEAVAGKGNVETLQGVELQYDLVGPERGRRSVSSWWRRRNFWRARRMSVES